VKLLHLIGFITKKCYDAHSHERKKKKLALVVRAAICVLAKCPIRILAMTQLKLTDILTGFLSFL